MGWWTGSRSGPGISQRWALILLLLSSQCSGVFCQGLYSVTTVVGSSNATLQSSLSSPVGIAFVSVTNRLLWSETGSDKILQFNMAGNTASMLAGSQLDSFNNSANPLQAAFFDPSSLAVDHAGDVWVADTGNHVIRKIHSGGVSTVAGKPTHWGWIDGYGMDTALLAGPVGLTWGPHGPGTELFWSDTLTHTIRKLNLATGYVSTVAGVPRRPGSADGYAHLAMFGTGGPWGLAFVGESLFIADRGNNAIRRLSNGMVEIYAGKVSDPVLHQNGLALNARFNSPTGLLAHSNGQLYVADSGNNVIRMISINQNVSTIGNHTSPEASGTSLLMNGDELVARFNAPMQMAFSINQTFLYVADRGNNAIRKVQLSDVSNSPPSPPLAPPQPPASLPPFTQVVETIAGVYGTNSAATPADAIASLANFYCSGIVYLPSTGVCQAELELCPRGPAQCSLTMTWNRAP